MKRYGIISQKFPREIVLLKASPCRWGKCRFCDHILDNSTDVPRMIATNRQVLRQVTGVYKRLEVIDSASVFELPEQSLEDIRQVVLEVGIVELVFEAHWMYRHRLQGLRDFFKRYLIIFYNRHRNLS